MNLCECGCGKEVTINKYSKKPNRFIKGHARQGKSHREEEPKKLKSRTSTRGRPKHSKYDNTIHIHLDDSLYLKIVEYTMKQSIEPNVWIMDALTNFFAELARRQQN